MSSVDILNGGTRIWTQIWRIPKSMLLPQRHANICYILSITWPSWKAALLREIKSPAFHWRFSLLQSACPCIFGIFGIIQTRPAKKGIFSFIHVSFFSNLTCRLLLHPLALAWKDLPTSLWRLSLPTWLLLAEWAQAGCCNAHSLTWMDIQWEITKLNSKCVSGHSWWP